MTPAIPWSHAFPIGRLLCCIAALAGSGGCADERAQSGNEYQVAESTKSEAPASAPQAPAEGATKPEAPPALPRKIIYNAQVTLVVESLTSVAEQIRQLVEASGGYISETEMSMATRSRRVGMWKVRVPVARFDAFMVSVSKLGELQRSHLDSQDVSEEFYDLEARISNKQQEEKRLQKHLADSTGKLEDILAVERELSRVRGEVEQMQGRLRFLANQTDLSTITLTVSEVKDYTPPVSPTLSTELVRTFRRSLDHLAQFGRALLLLIVAVTPWFVVIAVVAVPLWWLASRLRRRQ